MDELIVCKSRERYDMEEVVPLLFECGTCGNGFVESVDLRSFTTRPAEQKGREVSFTKQIDCPRCGAAIVLEYTIDKKTSRPRKAIHVTKKKSGSVWLVESATPEVKRAGETARATATKYRQALKYLDEAEQLDVEVLQEANRIAGSPLSSSEMQSSIDQSNLMLPSGGKPAGLEALRDMVRNTLIEGIRTFDALADELGA
jgi:ribosomal protein S27AE